MYHDLTTVPATERPTTFFRDTAFLWLLAGFSLLLHLLTAPRCGFFIDELYLLASSRHASLCCAELFPMQLWMMKAAVSLFGTGPVALRVLPAAFGSATIFFAGLVARELGGKRFSISVVALSVLCAPLSLFASNFACTFYSESFWWTASAFVLLRVLQGGNQRIWYLLGFIWGCGLLDRPPILFFMMAVGFALLVTEMRTELLKKGYWSAVAVAAILCSPAFIWQAVHGFPLLRAIDMMATDEFAVWNTWLGYYSRSRILLALPGFLGPVTCALAVAGLCHFLLPAREKWRRFFAISVSAATAAFIISSGHPYYPNPVYPALLVIGSLAAESAASDRRGTWLRPAIVLAVLLQGILVVPLCTAILPRDWIASYSSIVARGPLAPVRSLAETVEGTDYGENAAVALDHAFSALPMEQKPKCRIIVGYASLASSAEFYGEKFSLPPIYCCHANWAFWGPPEEDSDPVITLFFNRKDLEAWFGEVREAGLFDNNPAYKVFTCRRPKYKYKKIWEEMCAREWAFRAKAARDM